MSGKSHPTSKSRAPSWFSRHFKRRAPSPLSPSSPASSSHASFRLPGGSMGSLALPVDLADKDVSPVAVSRRPSISSVSAHSTTNPTAAHPSTSLDPLQTSPCRQHLSVSHNDTKKIDTIAYPTDTADLPPEPPSLHPPVPSGSTPSITKSVPAQPPRSLSASPQDLLLYQRPPSSNDNTEKLDTSTHYADVEPVPAFTSHPPSPSRAFIASTSNSPSAASILSPQYPTHRIEDSTGQNYSSTNPVPPIASPLSQGRALNCQGPSVSVL
jgi:hypothetical protein